MLMDRNNPHGGDRYGRTIRIDFSANVNPLGTPETVKHALTDILDTLSYYPDAYCRRLRAALSGYDRIPYSQILCGNGAADLIYAFSYAVGGKALAAVPTFSEYRTAWEAAGGTFTTFLMRECDGFRPDENFLSHITDKIDAVFLCVPNNPTGVLYDVSFVRAVADRCQTVGARLFLDCCFLDLSDGRENYDIPALLKNYPNLFVLKAFTKSYGMAGIRLGYGLCSDTALLERMAKKVPCWNVSSVAQEAGIAALADTAFLERFRNLISEEKPYLLESLSRFGFKVYDGAANFLLFCTEKPLYDALFNRGILIRSCANFEGLDSRYYRIAVRTHEENKILIQAIEEILK